MQAPNLEPRSYARLHGRIPINGAPAPRFGAPPDGYTLLLAAASHPANVILYRNLQFDLVRDFAPVTLLATSPSVVVVHPSLPVKSIGDLVGFPGFQFGSWNGIIVPAKTPKETIARIHGATMAALKNPDVNKRLTDLGYVIVGDQPEQFAAFIKSEIESLGQILRELRGTAE